MDDVHGQENEPATKRDLAAVKVDLKADVGTLKTELSTVQEAMKAMEQRILEDNEKTRRHFDVVAENIHRDVAGANADEISLIKDQQLPDHEERITALEQHTGLRHL